MKNKLLFLIIIFIIFSSSIIYSEDNKSDVKFQLEDSSGQIITFEKMPVRIISLAPNITELIFALGAEDLLVGRTQFCDYPPGGVKNISSVGTIMNPSIESIVALEPDLIIASTHFQKETLHRLKELDIKVFITWIGDDYFNIYSLIEQIGIITQRQENAGKIIKNMKSKISEIEEKTIGKKRPRVYYMISFGDEGDFTAGKDTYISQLIKIAGGENTADNSASWQYSLEEIIMNDPDIIICSNKNNVKSKLYKTPVYNQLRAVKTNHVYEINNDMLDRIGPRNIEGIMLLYSIFHKK